MTLAIIVFYLQSTYSCPSTFPTTNFVSINSNYMMIEIVNPNNRVYLDFAMVADEGKNKLQNTGLLKSPL